MTRHRPIPPRSRFVLKSMSYLDPAPPRFFRTMSTSGPVNTTELRQAAKFNSSAEAYASPACKSQTGQAYFAQEIKG